MKNCRKKYETKLRETIIIIIKDETHVTSIIEYTIQYNTYHGQHPIQTR